MNYHQPTDAARLLVEQLAPKLPAVLRGRDFDRVKERIATYAADFKATQEKFRRIAYWNICEALDELNNHMGRDYIDLSAVHILFEAGATVDQMQHEASKQIDVAHDCWIERGM